MFCDIRGGLYDTRQESGGNDVPRAVFGFNLFQVHAQGLCVPQAEACETPQQFQYRHGIWRNFEINVGQCRAKAPGAGIKRGNRLDRASGAVVDGKRAAGARPHGTTSML
jgi:hypothetical protein